MFLCSFLVSQGYLYFWRDEGERAPLSPEQAVALFGNVDDIYRFNSQFLTQLQSCGLDPVEVARCFVRNNSGFTIYTDYCTNYPRWALTLSLFSPFLFIVRLDGKTSHHNHN
jgi:hypothetical protein